MACQQAGGYEREIVGGIDSVAVAAAMPQYLPQLVCEGEEETLLECESYGGLGSDCVSGEAPVITCRGQ